MRDEVRLPAAGARAPAGTPEFSASGQIVCRRAGTDLERDQHHAIRRRIFVDEQAIFTESDIDVHDADPSAIALLGYCDGVVAGTVRLFALDVADGLWQGDRLAVLGPYRMRGLGAPLVRCAVATAAVYGGRRMCAHIQLANVRFFQRLGWETEGGSEIYAGVPHQPMSVDLPPPHLARTTVERLAVGVSARDL